MKQQPFLRTLGAALFLGVAILILARSTAQAQPPWLQPPSGTPSEGTPRSSSGAVTAGEAVIQADPETGSLIIITDDETNERIRRVIEALDRPVPQALIKVLFLEVTHSKGSDWNLQGALRWGPKDATTLSRSEVTFQPGYGFVEILARDLDLTLTALAEVAKLEVLSRPSILARNNQEAVITVGQEVPFIRNSRITQEGQTINTVEYDDIGIILRVTPHISPDGLVEMDVAPEISTLTGDSVPISEGVTAPVFAKRSAETCVVVPDGRTVVIGGLMEDQDTESIGKIPMLGDIPYLGLLFQRKTTSKSKTELLIFLTPHVVRSTEQLADLSRSEKEKADLSEGAFTQEQLEKYLGEWDD
ncbi:MAG TPA: hypothetical protein VM492_09810 [Sumerlaeia bacterium]|nr:hypothetical protein [Sumerlaeia bacterium]